MNENVLVSIIVPIYKVENYLEKCLESIIAQTHKNLQIILIDDGSPDGCGKICDTYAKKDSRITVIHQENKGLSAARNAGFEIVKGKYIGFVDSDDYIAADMYENLVTAIEKYDTDISMCSYYKVENNVVSKAQYPEIKDCVYSKNEALKELLIDHKIQNFVWNKLYKKELFLNVRFPDGKEFEDIATIFYIFEKINSIVKISQTNYFYVTRPESIVNDVSRKSINNYLEFSINRYMYIHKKYPELKIYNDYKLVSTTVRAFYDAFILKDAEYLRSDNFKKLYDKFKSLMKKEGPSILSLMDEEEKMNTCTLAYNIEYFKRLVVYDRNLHDAIKNKRSLKVLNNDFNVSLKVDI
ncbi:glycosyltransferase [[Clostridium] fimetarium]|uniref:Glycosyltransferase involved in cell wall bisynthesis n=1 Tax=[Clostridium] fimetarium TaxID=99656 RepID=A0A1I0RUA2_9FIRM|nr:glycosyltransferase [[Clostridium] fimetarium]SEW45007.1 Glycosyltransferase involved in cell wall bisynthesis [[Clostridium] fimetarium]